MSSLPSNPSAAFVRLNPHLYGNNVDAMKARAKAGEPMIQLDKPKKRIRQSSKPLLNKLEQEFLDEVLKWRFSVIEKQAIRFKLGNGNWYKPDFTAWPIGLESQDVRMRAYEVKGPHAFRGGFENLKVAASKYSFIRWKLVWKENGQWKEQTVLP